MSWKTGLMLLICDLLNLIQTFDGMKINLPLNKREKTKRLWITKTFCSTVKLKKSMKILHKSYSVSTVKAICIYGTIHVLNWERNIVLAHFFVATLRLFLLWYHIFIYIHIRKTQVPNTTTINNMIPFPFVVYFPRWIDKTSLTSLLLRNMKRIDALGLRKQKIHNGCAQSPPFL